MPLTKEEVLNHISQQELNKQYSFVYSVREKRIVLNKSLEYVIKAYNEQKEINIGFCDCIDKKIIDTITGLQCDKCKKPIKIK